MPQSDSSLTLLFALDPNSQMEEISEFFLSKPVRSIGGLGVVDLAIGMHAPDLLQRVGWVVQMNNTMAVGA